MEYTTDQLRALSASDLFALYRRKSRQAEALEAKLDTVKIQRRAVDALIKEKTGVRKSWQDEQKKLARERQQAGGLHEQGYTIRRIAIAMGISEGQAASRVRQWKKANVPDQ